MLHGAPMGTFDLDVVHSRTEQNIARLLAALEELDAFYRTQPEKRLRPRASHLASAGHQLLLTRFGPLDLLGAVGHGLGYDDLRPQASEMEVGKRVGVLVLSLEKLIEIKEQTAGEKDKAALPLLRRTLEEKRRR